MIGAALWLFPGGEVFADLIHLRNGKVIEGFFLNQEGGNLVFETFEGKVRIPASNVKKMEVGYTGIPVCYTMENGDENCNALLHQAGPDEMLIVTERGSLKRNMVPSKRIEKITFEKEKDDQKLLPHLSRGVGIRIHIDGLPLQGTVESMRGNELTVKRSDQTLVTVGEQHLNEGELYAPERIPPPEKRFRTMNLLPGVSQTIDGDYWTGGAILFSMAVLGGGIYSEFQSASGLDDAAMSDPMFLLFNQGDYQSRFESHKQNQTALGGVMLLVYLYHLYDVEIWKLEDSPRYEPVPEELSGKFHRPSGFAFHIRPDSQPQSRSFAPGGSAMSSRYTVSYTFRF